MVVRLLKQVLRECGHVTTPEVGLSAVFAVAAFVFKWLLGGGLSIQDFKSFVIPLIWTACLIGGWLLFKAAKQLYQEDLDAWKQWKPTIPEAEDLRPSRPTPKPVAFPTAVGAVFLVIVIILAFTLGRSKTGPVPPITTAPNPVPPSATSSAPTPIEPQQSQPPAQTAKPPKDLAKSVAVELSKLLPGTAYPHAPSPRANLGMEFFGKSMLSFNLVDEAEESASEPRYWFGIWDLDHPAHTPNIPAPQPLQIPAAEIKDFVFHGSRYGPLEVLSSTGLKEQVRQGDRLFGVAEVRCFNCAKERAYYIYFKVGSGGWYAEASGDVHGAKFIMPGTAATDADISELFDSEIPLPLSRIELPATAPPIPTFTETPRDFVLIAGGPSHKFSVNKSSSAGGPSGIQLFGEITPALSAYIEKDRLFIDTQLYYAAGKPPLQLVHNDLRNRPPEWDRNFDDSAIEIVDDKGKPRFQLIYQDAGIVLLRGIFQFEKRAVVLEETNRRFFIVADSNDAPSPEMETGPLFKYPSRLHKGEELPDGGRQKVNKR